MARFGRRLAYGATVRGDRTVALQIDHLFNHPEHTQLVATWIYDEFWRDKPGYSVATFELLLGEAIDPGRIPLSLLALVDGDPIGTVNLIHNDSPSRPQLYPWLAALFVVPRHRHQGVGGALCRALVSEAGLLHVSEVFLGTDIPAFYSALGAELYEQVSDTACIMRFRIAP